MPKVFNYIMNTQTQHHDQLEEASVTVGVEVSVEDLVIDKRVTVTGERSEDGIIKANSILIRPGGSGFGGASTSN